MTPSETIVKHDARIRKTLTESLDLFAQKKGVGPDRETRDELVDYLIHRLSSLLHYPSSKQVLLVDCVGNYGNVRYTNPRIEDHDGRDIEEILYPIDGEDKARADLVIPLPLCEALPEI